MQKTKSQSLELMLNAAKAFVWYGVCMKIVVSPFCLTVDKGITCGLRMIKLKHHQGN
jgi:hypothetical protein